MAEFYINKIEDVKKNIKLLEEHLNVKMEVIGRKVIFKGEPFEEYVAEIVFNAISFGFSVKRAIILKSEENTFRIVHIKKFTKRKLRDVQARLIGKKGKTKKIFKEISGCEIIIKEGEVGIIGNVEAVSDVENAVIHLIKGSKQSNMYRFLERMNRERKKNKYQI